MGDLKFEVEIVPVLHKFNEIERVTVCKCHNQLVSAQAKSKAGGGGGGGGGAGGGTTKTKANASAAQERLFCVATNKALAQKSRSWNVSCHRDCDMLSCAVV